MSNGNDEEENQYEGGSPRFYKENTVGVGNKTLELDGDIVKKEDITDNQLEGVNTVTGFGDNLRGDIKFYAKEDFSRQNP